MQAVKRAFEWYLGVPPAGPGEGTSWRLEWSSPWPAWMPQWLAVVLIAAVVATIVAVYLRESERLGRRPRMLLVGLRLLAFALVLVFLTHLRLGVDRTGLATVAVLVDDSASMGLEDRYRDPKARKAVERLLRTRNGGATRLDVAQALLSRNDARLLERLAEGHELRAFRFSERTSPIGSAIADGDDGSNTEALVKAIDELEPQGPRTDPAGAITAILDRSRGTPPAAIVLFTDGIATAAGATSFEAAAERARSLGVPVFTVGIGSDERARDLQLYDGLIDELAFVDDPVRFSAKLRATGIDEDSVELVLRDEESDRVLERKTVPVPPDGDFERVEIAHAVSEPGRYRWRLEVAARPRETTTENNAVVRDVTVRDERIRVLLADNVPRYEYRFVKHVLEREPTIEVRTVLQDADVEYAADDRTALEHFPVRMEELAEFDVIVLGDVDPTFLGPLVLENVRKFVDETGGGLLLVAGRFHNPLDYRETPLEPLFPIGLDTAVVPDANAVQESGFRPRLTPAGKAARSLFRFGEDDRESLEVWNELPELYWMVSASETPPGAIVLAERTAVGGVGKSAPVIAMQRYGAGKALFHATDDLWLWRHRVGDLYYGRYWVQAVRTLSRSRILSGESKVELTTDRVTYDRGESVRLRARFLDESALPDGEATVRVAVESSGGKRHTVDLARLPQATNAFEGRLPGLPTGSYHAWLADPAVGESPPAADFRVEASDAELLKTELARGELATLAKATYGAYYSPADASELAEDLPRGRPVRLEVRDPIPLWNRPELLLAFVAVLAAEWLVRKRHRLV